MYWVIAFQKMDKPLKKMDNPPVKSGLGLHPHILFGNRSFIINTIKKEVDASIPANQLCINFVI